MGSDRKAALAVAAIAVIVLAGCTDAGGTVDGRRSDAAQGPEAGQNGSHAGTVTGADQGGAASPPAGSSCPSLEDDRTDTANPEDVASTGMGWADFGPLRLPASKASGPGVTEGQVARCYARTPRGAVLALVNISTRAANGPDWRSVVNQQVFPDAAKDVFERGTAANRSGKPDYPEKSNRMVPAGCKIVTFTPDSAVVDIAYRNPGGTATTVLMTARWHKGDWKQQMAPGGGVSESVLSRFNTHGYILFPQE